MDRVKRARGFTLVEMLVSMMIMSIALIVLGDRIGGSYNVKKNLYVREAMLLSALNELEARRLIGSSVFVGKDKNITSFGMQFKANIRVEGAAYSGLVREDALLDAGDGERVGLFRYRKGAP